MEKGINNKTKRCLAVFVAFVLLLSFHLITAIGETSIKKTAGSCTAEIKNIYNSGKVLYVCIDFKNTSSSPESFAFTFSVKAWQKGYECDVAYFSGGKNSTSKVKDGAIIDVVETYTLKDTTSLVEINLDEWLTWSSKPITVYYNPQTKKWGEKSKVGATSTPKPTETPKPTATPQPKVESTEVIIDNHWICPSCGNELESKFCPDCGTTSPTPQPTATPTPAPTEVPMDPNKPVEAVVKYGYTAYLGDNAYEGVYTGELVDGFPHGYGFFECDDWFYYGEWKFGSFVDEENLYNLLPSSSYSKLFEKYFKISVGNVENDGKILSVPYTVSIKDSKLINDEFADNIITVNVMTNVYRDKSRKELLASKEFVLNLRKGKAYCEVGRWRISLPEGTGSDVYFEYLITEIDGKLER